METQRKCKKPVVQQKTTDDGDSDSKQETNGDIIAENYSKSTHSSLLSVSSLA